MGFFQEGSESFPVETALKNSCNVKLAISKKQSGTCIPKETPKKRKMWAGSAAATENPLAAAAWCGLGAPCPALLFSPYETDLKNDGYKETVLGESILEAVL